MCEVVSWSRKMVKTFSSLVKGLEVHVRVFCSVCFYKPLVFLSDLCLSVQGWAATRRWGRTQNSSVSQRELWCFSTALSVMVILKFRWYRQQPGKGPIAHVHILQWWKEDRFTVYFNEDSRYVSLHNRFPAQWLTFVHENTVLPRHQQPAPKRTGPWQVLN